MRRLVALLVPLVLMGGSRLPGADPVRRSGSQTLPFLSASQCEGKAPRTRSLGLLPIARGTEAYALVGAHEPISPIYGPPQRCPCNPLCCGTGPIRWRSWCGFGDYCQGVDDPTQGCVPARCGCHEPCACEQCYIV